MILGEAIMENYGTIWVCQCCMLSHANGECCDTAEAHTPGRDARGRFSGGTVLGDGYPLSRVRRPFHVAMGMAYEEHAEDCETRIHNGAPDNYECDCETNTYSTSQCEGCGSYLHGERHAMTLFKESARPATPPVLEDIPALLRRLYDAARDVKH